MIEVFADSETLKCDICSEVFTGKKQEGGGIVCPACFDKFKEYLPVAEKEEDIPDSVHEEMDGGRGIDDAD